MFSLWDHRKHFSGTHLGCCRHTSMIENARRACVARLAGLRWSFWPSAFGKAQWSDCWVEGNGGRFGEQSGMPVAGRGEKWQSLQFRAGELSSGRRFVWENLEREPQCKLLYTGCTCTASSQKHTIQPTQKTQQRFKDAPSLLLLSVSQCPGCHWS